MGSYDEIRSTDRREHIDRMSRRCRALFAQSSATVGRGIAVSCCQYPLSACVAEGATGWCPFTGWFEGSCGGGWGCPGIAGEGLVDGVDGAESVVVCAGEVGADSAESGEGGGGVPVAGDFLVQVGAFQRLLAGVVDPGHGERGGEQPDLVGLLASRVASV
jgi:hypothetical protein